MGTIDAILRAKRAIRSWFTGRILRDGEFAYETDQKGLKIGDGGTTYASLPYLIPPRHNEHNKYLKVVNGNVIWANGYDDTAIWTAVNGKYTFPAGGIPKTDLSSSVQDSLDLADTAIQDISGKQDIAALDTDVAALGFVKNTVNDLLNYYLKTETYTQAEVNALIGGMSGFTYEIYASLSDITSPAHNVLYLIGPTGSGSDKYKEYVYPVNDFVKIGDTSIDLSGYVTTSDLNTALAAYTTTTDLTTLLAGYQTKIDANNKLDYSLLDNTPEIPSAGIPAGGNAGQVLKKTSATDYDVNWANASETLPSAYCTTSGSTAAKKANCSLYVTQANQYLQVLIGSANTYQGALTLNINSAGAKPIYINGTASSPSNYTLPNGTYFVFYDGTNYYFRTDGKLPMKDAAFGGSYNDLSDTPALAAVAMSGDYLDLDNTPTIPIVNDATLKIQRNGTDLDTFTANASQNKTINIVVPTTASDVSALPASTKYGASLSLSINSSTYVITAQLKDQDNNNLGSAQTVDLPLESVVVNGSYDDVTKKIILTLQNGNTIEFSVADLVSGLQTEITANDPLSADLIVDGTTNKVYTATEQGKLSGIEAGAEVNVQPDWNQSDNTADDYIKNKPSIPAEQIQSDWNQSDNTQKDYIKNKPTIPSVTSKADKVSGATNGNFAGLDSNGNLTDSGHKHSDYLTSHQDISGKADKVTSATNGHLAGLDSNGNLTDSDVPKGILDKMPSTLGTAGQAIVVNNAGTGLEFKTVSGGGGLSNYDFTELSAPTISGGACTITFAADQRNGVEFSTNADLAIALVSNNKADNYIWITNSHATTAIDITFSSIMFGSTAINDIKGTASIPSIEAGETLEIGIYVTDTKARITSRIL